MKKAVLIFNMPAPYRERIFEIVGEQFGDNFTVVFCQKMESDRQWDNIGGNYHKVFLKERVFTYHNYYKRHVHYNPDVWSTLNKLNPDIVITYGYNPTYLFAYMWAKMKRRKHLVFSDVSYSIEKSLTFAHKLLRKIIVPSSQAYIAASDEASDLLIQHGAKKKNMFFSHLCANNDLFFNYQPNEPRKYDLMFSGRLISSKLPLFFGEVARLAKEKLGHISVLILGDGELKGEMVEFMEKHDITYHYPGFIKQQDLPKYYYQAKIFLFPTLIDCWGVVVNEACAAGLPVITCENTAAAGELVKDGVNGYVLPLEERQWADAVVGLLTDEAKLLQFSSSARKEVERYSYENAAQGIINAVSAVS